MRLKAHFCDFSSCCQQVKSNECENLFTIPSKLDTLRRWCLNPTSLLIKKENCLYHAFKFCLLTWVACDGMEPRAISKSREFKLKTDVWFPIKIAITNLLEPSWNHGYFLANNKVCLCMKFDRLTVLLFHFHFAWSEKWCDFKPNELQQLLIIIIS